MVTGLEKFRETCNYLARIAKKKKQIQINAIEKLERNLKEVEIAYSWMLSNGNKSENRFLVFFDDFDDFDDDFFFFLFFDKIECCK